MKIKKQGRRHYARGTERSVSWFFKDNGFNWDGDKRMWWTGKANLADASQKAFDQGKVKAEDTNKVRIEDKVILGWALYQARSGSVRRYYICAQSTQSRLCLTILDGSFKFWISEEQALSRTYYQSPRSLKDLREYRERKDKQECRCMANCRCSVSGYCPEHHDGCDICGRDSG